MCGRGKEGRRRCGGGKGREGDREGEKEGGGRGREEREGEIRDE